MCQSCAPIWYSTVQVNVVLWSVLKYVRCVIAGVCAFA